jgi:hypothetical protein
MLLKMKNSLMKIVYSMNIHQKINVRSYFFSQRNDNYFIDYNYQPYTRFMSAYNSKCKDIVTMPNHWYCTKKKDTFKFKF